MKFVDGQVAEYPVATNTTIGVGAAVITNASGFAVPATAGASGQRILGIATEHVVNTGANAARSVTTLKRGIVDATASTGASFTQATVGAQAFLDGYDTGNQRPFVHSTSTGRTALGTVVAVQGTTVWVMLSTV